MQKLLTFFSTKILAYIVCVLFNDQRFNDTLTNDIVSFEQLGPDIFLITPQKHMFLVSLEALLMSTHNMCFCGEIRKLLCGYLLLSGAV